MMPPQNTPPIDYDHRNAATLAAFTEFCQQNPQLRFWQALAVWTDSTIYQRPVGRPNDLFDTWSHEGKNC